MHNLLSGVGKPRRKRQRSGANGTGNAVQHCLSDKETAMPLFWLPLILYAGLMDLLLTPPRDNE